MHFAVRAARTNHTTAEVLATMQEAKVSRAELEALIHNEPFMQGYDMEIVSLGYGKATLMFPYRERFNRPGGLISGPVLMAAADAAFWFALMTQIGFEPMAVTAELNTAFLRPAVREAVYCDAEVLKCGSKLVYGTAACRSDNGRLFSHHTVTYIRAATPQERT